MDEWSAAETSTLQHSALQETDIHTPGGIRTRISVREQPQTHALDRSATGIGHKLIKL